MTHRKADTLRLLPPPPLRATGRLGAAAMDDVSPDERRHVALWRYVSARTDVAPNSSLANSIAPTR
eukprot:7373940-Prymnesium_polylepis.1